MEAAPVIKGFDKIEDGLASLGPGFKAAPVDEFEFEGAPEGIPWRHCHNSRLCGSWRLGFECGPGPGENPRWRIGSPRSEWKTSFGGGWR